MSFKTFSEEEQAMLKRPLKRAHLGEQEKRTACIQDLDNHTRDYIAKQLSSYTLPGEIVHLGKDLAGIKETKLTKKICKAMLTTLKKAYPDKDFSALECTYTKNPEPEYTSNGAFAKDRSLL